jgi:glucose/arabinose dehydrogenase
MLIENLASRVAVSSIAVGLVAALTACASAVPSGPAVSAPPSTAADVTVLAEGLASPWSAVFVGDSMLVSERDSGRVMEVAADGAIREAGTIANAAGAIRGEGGLLGLAIDGSGRLYAYMTTSTDNRIERFELEGEPGSLTLGDAETVLEGLPFTWFHNGGRIAFGPDGMLYAGTGDAGQANASQDVSILAGKILRMTPDGEVPADNPFPDSLVYSYGHRNVQGFAWSADGTMFASEFGQDTWDELNVIVPGANYGWPNVEGQAGDPSYTDPVQQWRPDEASPSGMTIVDETIYMANLGGQRLRAVRVSDPTAHEDFFVGVYGRLRDVLPAPEGGVLVVTNNTDGRGNPGPDDDRILRVTFDD